MRPSAISGSFRAADTPKPCEEVVCNSCMSHWFPKLEASGVPVPRTKMLSMPKEAYRDIFNLFDGKPLEGKAAPFLAAVQAAGDEIGWPVFLRTGLTSGKHSWSNTCHFADRGRVVHHVASIVEFSECCDFVGLSCDWWAVREMLPTMPLAVCPRYYDMPVCREFRCFVENERVLCVHPYWPAKALEMGGASDPELLASELAITADLHEVKQLASRAGAAVGGEWSVDVLETKRGWYVTDMAQARESFHWPECPPVEEPPQYDVFFGPARLSGKRKTQGPGSLSAHARGLAPN